MTMDFRMARNRGSSDDGFAFSKQQHGEGKEQKKPVCGPPWREFTDEELEAYKKKAEESEGFDVGEVPEDVFMAIILPCPLDEPASALWPYNKMAKKALAAYNNEKGTTYKFVKHIRVNRKGGGVGSSYFITVPFRPRIKKSLEEPKVCHAYYAYCILCLKGYMHANEKMLKDPWQLYAPSRLYHIIARKPFRLCVHCLKFELEEAEIGAGARPKCIVRKRHMISSRTYLVLRLCVHCLVLELEEAGARPKSSSSSSS